MAAVETHWSLSVTQPDAGTTHVECGCGWDHTLVHGKTLREQTRGIQDARRRWYDHPCEGRPFVHSSVTNDERRTA